jgi:hypothetical protein
MRTTACVVFVQRSRCAMPSPSWESVAVSVTTGEVVACTEKRLATGDAVKSLLDWSRRLSPARFSSATRRSCVTRDAVEVAVFEPRAQAKTTTRAREGVS